MLVGDSDALVRRVRGGNKDLAALFHLPLRVQLYEPDQHLVREGDEPNACFTILDGLACSYKQTGDGSRQITAFHIAGDIPDLYSLHLRMIDTSIRTITGCTVGYLPHSAVHEVCASSYAAASALWRLSLIDGSIFREWETNLGQRDAPARMAHLLCEQFARLKAVGLAEGNSFSFQVTQTQLGDALGISTVHVNRTLQNLRGKGLVLFEQGKVEISDWEALKVRGDFQDAYLHLGDAG
jgi:CRP-like cAMP-binding protein